MRERLISRPYPTGGYVESNFAKDYQDLVRKFKTYYGSLDSQQVYYINQLIEQLRDYIDFGNAIERFEDKYRTSDVSYALMKTEEYREKNHKNPPFFSYDMWKKEWKGIAERKDYHAMYGIVTFIEEVVSILEELARNNNTTFIIPESLNELAKMNTGFNNIDRANDDIAKALNKTIEIDLKAYKQEAQEEVEDSIKGLRNTALYKHKNNSGLRTGDARFIGEEKRSYTFNEVFERIRSESKTIDVSHSKSRLSKDDSKELIKNSYFDRIEKLGNLINALENGYNSRLDSETIGTECSFQGFEREEISNRLGDALFQIDELKKLYDQLMPKKEKLVKHIKYIDAVKQRIAYIDEAIRVLDSRANHDPKNVGNVSIFKESLKMLHEKKNESLKLLEGYQKLMDDMDILLGKVYSIETDINMVFSKIDRIISVAKQRKADEVEESLRRMHEGEEKDKARKEEIRLQTLDRLKDEVNRKLASRFVGPDLEIIDIDHYVEHYEEYNKLFRQLLITLLHEANIEFTENDLFNPLDTKYHVEHRDDKEIPKQVNPNLYDTEGNPKLKKETNGLYTVTEKDYLYFYEMFERKMQEKRQDYFPDEIEFMVRDYIDRHYGIDNIYNKKEFNEIISNHRRALREAGKRR